MAHASSSGSRRRIGSGRRSKYIPSRSPKAETESAEGRSRSISRPSTCAASGAVAARPAEMSDSARSASGVCPATQAQASIAALASRR